MAQSGRNTEMAAGMSMSNSMSSNTASSHAVVSENMWDGNSSASKMGADKSGFKFPGWTPPPQAPNKPTSPTSTGRLGNFGFRGGGGMFASSRLNR